MVILTVFLGIAYLILCILIVFFVLIQPSKKGGGLGGLGGGAAAAGALSDTLGQTEAEQTLARYTKYGMVVFFVLSLVLTIASNSASGTNINLAPAVAPGTPGTTINVPADGTGSITIPAEGTSEGAAAPVFNIENLGTESPAPAGDSQ